MDQERVIAHISDLHFPHWSEETLQNLKDYLKGKRPLLILVTGDLTDNPNPWQQRRLKHKLDEFVECRRDSECCLDDNGAQRRDDPLASSHRHPRKSRLRCPR